MTCWKDDKGNTVFGVKQENRAATKQADETKQETRRTRAKESETK